MKISSSIFTILFICLVLIANGQGVAINNDGSPADASAILDVKSTTKGVLIPRLTNVQRDAIASPVAGLLIFNTDQQGLQMFDGTIWSTYMPSWECGNNLIDSRDGKAYSTVQIGTKCWMSENLNIGTRIDGPIDQSNNSMIEKYCYDDSETNCNTYGGLYLWGEMMQYVTTEGTQGICPTGWYLPTDDEWKTMETCLGMSQSEADATNWRGTDEGGKMKEAGTSHWDSPNTGATNSSGFTALPGGWRSYYNGSFVEFSTHGHWWSSTEFSDNDAWYRRLYYDYSQVNRNLFSKMNGRSVRCIKN